MILRLALFSAALVAATSACNSESGNAPTGPLNIEPVAPPAGQSWDQMVTTTDEGGFLMGNPDAPVKLIEFGSMTCPHCADFDDSVEKLVADYVKTGKVSFEFRNYVRDPFDLTASLIARCGGPERFFPLTHAMFASQEEWVGKLQQSQQQLEAAMNVGPERQFVEIAKIAGLQTWAAQRGVTSAQSTQCLSNQAEIDRLVQMNADAGQQFSIPGTPSFVINGKLVENAASWESLEPKLREALGS